MTPPKRRPRARINAVTRGRAVAMTKLEHQFKRFNRRYPAVAVEFAKATDALAKLTAGRPTAVGALGITRTVVKQRGTLRRVGKSVTAVDGVGLPNELAPYYARLYNARHSYTTGIKYDTRKA